ncbi:unnamed protein product [Lactuca saligna]|uniref:Uncharacterized protein n=1 Tax=Lactuca saligna TaxID=75948 RepID=A0AA35ZSZ4_LACSI|nr:unnamed protein product [Lactuca saligna]
MAATGRFSGAYLVPGIQQLFVCVGSRKFQQEHNKKKSFEEVLLTSNIEVTGNMFKRYFWNKNGLKTGAKCCDRKLEKEELAAPFLPLFFVFDGFRGEGRAVGRLFFFLV